MAIPKKEALRFALPHADAKKLKTKITEALKKLTDAFSLGMKEQRETIACQHYIFHLVIEHQYALEKYFDKTLLMFSQYQLLLIEQNQDTTSSLGNTRLNISMYDKDTFINQVNAFFEDPVLDHFINKTPELKDVSHVTKEVTTFFPLFTYLESQEIEFKASFDTKQIALVIETSACMITIPVKSNEHDEWIEVNKTIKNLSTGELTTIFGIDTADTIVHFIVAINAAHDIH